MRSAQISKLSQLKPEPGAEITLSIGITDSLGSSLVYVVEKNGATNNLRLIPQHFANDREALEALESGLTDAAIVQTQQLVKRLPYFRPGSAPGGFAPGLVLPLYEDASPKAALYSSSSAHKPGVMAYIPGTPGEYTSVEALTNPSIISKYGYCKRLPISDIKNIGEKLQSGQIDIAVTDKDSAKHHFNSRFTQTDLNSSVGPDIYLLVYNRQISPEKLGKLKRFLNLWFNCAKSISGSHPDSNTLYTIIQGSNKIREDKLSESLLENKLTSSVLVYYSIDKANQVRNSDNLKSQVFNFSRKWSSVDIYNAPFEPVNGFVLTEAYDKIIKSDFDSFSEKNIGKISAAEPLQPAASAPSNKQTAQPAPTSSPSPKPAPPAAAKPTPTPSPAAVKTESDSYPKANNKQPAEAKPPAAPVQTQSLSEDEEEQPEVYTEEEEDNPDEGILNVAPPPPAPDKPELPQ
ncbi:hypothetical protein IJT93_02090 [bacterium]|nr:hypothetical protein [bacterium]